MAQQVGHAEVRESRLGPSHNNSPRPEILALSTLSRSQEAVSHNYCGTFRRTDFGARMIHIWQVLDFLAVAVCLDPRVCRCQYQLFEEVSTYLRHLKALLQLQCPSCLLLPFEQHNQRPCQPTWICHRHSTKPLQTSVHPRPSTCKTCATCLLPPYRRLRPAKHAVGFDLRASIALQVSSAEGFSCSPTSPLSISTL